MDGLLVKARYRGVCRGCGAPTAPLNGKGVHLRVLQTLPSRRDCAGMDTGTGSRSDPPWRAVYGAAPSSYDGSRTHARRRGGEALKRLQAGQWRAPSTVIDLYGTWAKALADTFGA